MMAMSGETSDLLSWISGQQNNSIELLKSLAEINSGTSNLVGLSTMHDELDKLFSPLADHRESIALSNINSVDDSGGVDEIKHGRLLRYTKRKNAPFRILLCGHMDTVFSKNHSFQSVRLVDQRYMHGPGVADMKGGILTMLLALQAWEKSPNAELLGWEVLLNPDEETGSLASAPYIAESAKRNHIGLVYEPALEDGTLAGARKGSGNFSLIVRGRSAHAGREFEKGRNAIAALAMGMQKLHKLNGGFPGITLNLGRVTGGGALNTVADLAICRFNLRADSLEGMSWLKEKMALCLAELNRIDGISAELQGGFNRQPKPMSAPLQQMFSILADCGKDLGIQIRSVPTGGCCDGNNLTAEGLPNIDTLGVRGGKIHTAEEFMVLDSLTERARLSLLFLEKMALQAREGQLKVRSKKEGASI